MERGGRVNSNKCGCPDDPERAEAFATTLRTVAALHRSIIAIRMMEVGEEKEFMHRTQSLAGDLPRIVFVDSDGGVSLES